MDDGVITLDEARRRDEEARRGSAANSMTGQRLPRIADGSADRWLGKEPAPLEFTIEDLVPEGMVTLFVADGGAGKSLLAQLAIACFPTGKPFLGKATKPGAAGLLYQAFYRVYASRTRLPPPRNRRHLSE